MWNFAVAATPTSCADVVQINSEATDGVYWLYSYDGCVQLYCHNMTGTPKSYIILRDPENNYGEQYNDGARTKFNRVAVDPQVR